MSILQSKRYNPNSVYSQNPGGLVRPPTLMRDDAWDARGSMDSQRQGGNTEELAGLRHGAHPSQSGGGYGQGQEGYGAPNGQGYASAVDDGRYDDAADHRRSAYNYGEPSYAPGGGAYGQQHQQYEEQQAYGQHQARHGYGGGGGGGYAVETPPEVKYGRDPGPTPELNQYRAGEGVGFGGGGGLSRPDAVQNHPG